MEEYLEILEESLKKKCGLLDRIITNNERQKEILSAEGTEFESFDELWEERDELLEEIDRLDDGFESVYERIASELQTKKENYKDRIERLQKLVQEVTDKVNSVQAQETRNKRLFEEYFAKRRREVKNGRASNRAAMSYYQTSNQSIGTPPPHFMDSKQ